MNKQLIGRRAAYLQRQQRVAERAAAAKEKERARVRDFDHLFGLNRTASSTFTFGDRVFHQKFGNGNVTAIDGSKLTIQFDWGGVRRILDDFVVRNRG